MSSCTTTVQAAGAPRSWPTPRLNASTPPSTSCCAAPALAALAARGVPCSVLTNKPEAMSRAILTGLGLAARFVAILGGDSLPVRKPDPAGLAQLRALTATARERMLLVGDSGVDVRTARAGGVAFCGVAWGLTPEALAAAL